MVGARTSVEDRSEIAVRQLVRGQLLLLLLLVLLFLLYAIQ